jgi:diguanylate cyclase (GGDEF)-like protein
MGLFALKNKKTSRQTQYSDLTEKWLDISITFLEPDHICVNITDVTDLKQGELRMKHQNDRLSTLSAELASSKNNLKLKLEKIETLNSSLEQLAYYDRLTHLPNRIRFKQIVDEELEAAQRTGGKLALAIFDIDNLKTLNDTQGHEAGDELLFQIAQRLEFFEKSHVQASRFGGDEFLLVIQNYEHDAELLHLLDSLQEILREPYMIFNAELKASVSMGISTYPEDGLTMPELLKYADIAMTDAKKRGKNTLSLFHSVMQENLLARINMENKMLRTLENELFQVYYQPQFDAETGRVRGFEALARWFDESLGFVSPDIFIPIAEETRLIIPLGDWIMRTACKTLVTWQKDFGFDGIMSVNVSPIQLRNSGFVDDLTGIVAEYALDPRSLEIEITEGVLISDFEQSIELLKKIKALGVGISLDDFGTGYSSLRYLQYLPLTTLKIDKSFISNLTLERSVEYDITDAIVTLVNKLGLDTIAEGVETTAQLEIIKKIQCRTIQGYLTGKPMHVTDCRKLLEKGVQRER